MVESLNTPIESVNLSSVDTAVLVEELNNREDKQDFIPDSPPVLVPPRKVLAPRPRGKNERI